MTSVIVSCYAIFDGYPWEACSFFFSKGNRGAVDLEERVGQLSAGTFTEVTFQLFLREEEDLLVPTT